jgi:predicted nucleic acid-binding protein
VAQSNDATIYWDTNVFVEYLKKTERAKQLHIPIMRAATEGNGPRIVTSIVTVAEVAFIANWGGASGTDLKRIDDMWRDKATITVVQTSWRIAREARSLIRTAHDQKPARTLHSLDAMHIATARIMGCSELHTHEGALIDLSPVLALTICEPRFSGTLPLAME